MDNEVCRAITLINYQIPPVEAEFKAPPYITMGFFDGMCTERIEVCYQEEELKSLWKYSIKRMDAQLGRYSYQNIFCISSDEWNQCSDDMFWNEDTNREYPLTFTVFLQLREYMVGKAAIEQQCRKFNNMARANMADEGLCYTYDTIDKNDFVVCLKCRRYGTAVKVIKSLHDTGAEIIYSYSVFSVARLVLTELQDDRYRYLFDEEIYSICLKGITNSFGLDNRVTLDQKYNEYCNKLVDKLYEGQEKDKRDYKIYDILGDDDFRLIARYVKLGKLLQQFAKEGMLCYEEGDFRFYFFSSNMVLNTLPEKGFETIGEEFIKNSRNEMVKEFKSPICDQLEKKMENISNIVSDNVEIEDERVLTFCHALWQLLQSLKPLETAPAKKYDFWSLYIPFAMLVDILEEKLGKALSVGATEEEKDFISNEEIYNFIHKISMTLHGTLRTDIQFFQIRDFNVIVHYAPAKLRAFYSMWVMRLTDYYSEFNTDGIKNKYCFILSPGMYQHTGVSELYTNYAENKRLMLIKVPERHLYAVKWLPVILTHEVSHFVGYASRKRMERHMACLKACIRVLFLETNYCRYIYGRPEWQPAIEEGIKNLKMYEEMKEELNKIEYQVRTGSHLYPHEFHSENSAEIIKITFREGNSAFLAKIIAEDSERINSFLKGANKTSKKVFEYQCIDIQQILKDSNTQYKELLALCQKFEFELLPYLLKILMYICKEAYADLIAILTLGLTPEEYIRSFSKSGCRMEGDISKEEGVLLIALRTGFTMQTIMDVTRIGYSCLSEDFFRIWSKLDWKELASKFKGTENVVSTEGRILAAAYAYILGIKDCNGKIEDYIPIYDYKENIFSGKILDFFNDREVWDSLLGYLSESAKTYVDILSKDAHIQEMRQKLFETYNKVSKMSMISMSQEIENFLAEFEMERKEVYKPI